MWTHRFEVPRRHASMMIWASRRLRNHSTLRHSSRNLPLNASFVPFCHGLPGIDDGGLNVRIGEPLQDGVAYELRTLSERR